MSSPSSCTRCSRLQDLLTPRGLCPECAATDATANPTLAAPLPPVAVSFAPTVTNPRLDDHGSRTRSAAPAAETTPSGSGTSLPDSPPDYELLGPLGHGGMGDVYLAREQTSGRRVAIKFLQRPKNPNEFNRFVSELQILANLDHPHIVRVFTSDFLRDTPFFTMEYMEGGSLAAALKPKPGTSEPNLLPVPAALRLIRQVAGACAAAHAKGVIHRDLKPGNILLAPDGTPKLGPGSTEGNRFAVK